MVPKMLRVRLHTPSGPLAVAHMLCGFEDREWDDFYHELYQIHGLGRFIDDNDYHTLGRNDPIGKIGNTLIFHAHDHPGMPDDNRAYPSRVRLVNLSEHNRPVFEESSTSAGAPPETPNRRFYFIFGFDTLIPEEEIETWSRRMETNELTPELIGKTREE